MAAEITSKITRIQYPAIPRYRERERESLTLDGTMNILLNRAPLNVVLLFNVVNKALVVKLGHGEIGIVHHGKLAFVIVQILCA